MMPVRIDVDFVRQSRRMPLSGLIVFALGTIAAYWTFTDHRDTIVSTEIVSMTLARYEADKPVGGDYTTVDTGAVEQAARRLTTPWSNLLQDLEAAAVDSGKDVALLEIAPDKNKQVIRVSGEARSLQHVLDYVRRLQSAESLSHPLLENHEVQKSVRERPVRFVVAANWRLAE
jgi:hypothetical protein